MDDQDDRQRGVKSVLSKLEASLNAGDYYQAQQIYKTLYARYIAKKRYLALRALLVAGAITMLKNKQLPNGTELALLLVKHYQEEKCPVNEETLGQVFSIFRSYPPELDKCKQQFITATINWSAQVMGNTYGSEEMHDVYAKEFDAIKDFAAAEKHYLLGTKSEDYAKMLVEWSKLGTNSEADLFIARAVFRYLLLNTQTACERAQQVLQYYTQERALETPLIHYLCFLIKIIENKANELFNPLKLKYSNELQRDSFFLKYVESIGKSTLGIEPPPQMSGLLGNLLQSFFN